MHDALSSLGISKCCVTFAAGITAVVWMPSGVLHCTKETRISQLRIAALDALSPILKAALDAGDLAADIHETSRSALEELLKNEKNAIVLGKAQSLHSLLKT